MNQKPSVEDVLIGTNRPVKKKSKLPTIIITFIIILLLACGGVFGYNYYKNYVVEKTKTKFFRYLSTNNIENLLNNEIYNTLFEKTIKQTNHSSLNLTATSSFKNKYDLDVSKFNITFNQITDKEQEKNFAELNVKYADNDLISARLINNKDSIAIASNEIADKYIGVNKADANKLLGNEINSTITTGIEALSQAETENLELSEEYRTAKINEYSKYVYDLISKDKFSEKNNILINTEEESNLNSNCYEFTTTYSEIGNIYISFLNKLKNDVEFLNKIAKEEDNSLSTDTNTSVNTNTSSNANNNISNTDITDNMVDSNQLFTSGNVTTDITPMNANVQATQTANFEVQFDTNSVNNTTEFNNQAQSNDATSEKTEMNFTSTSYSTLDDILVVKDIILGKKVNKTLDELQEMLENMIDDANELVADNTELKISQYVVNEKVKKITVKSTKLNIEIDFLSESNRDKIKLTVLTSDSSLTNSLDNIANELNSGNTENVEETTNETSGINNGFTIKIEKITSDMSTKINAEIGVVTNLEINTKLSLALTTTGTTNSKDIKNQAIITFTTQEGQLIATLNYNANFEKATTAIEDLTNENCLFLDKLNTEEFNNITKQITDRIETVINEKKVVLNLIDQNNNTSIIEQGNTNNTVAKDDARQKLIDVVTGMMAEVQNRGEVFTLNNLVGLQIEGYNVSCSVNGNIATIVVNGYTFYIDSDFNLTEE